MRCSYINCFIQNTHFCFEYPSDNPVEFQIDSVFQVPGTGIVVVGIMTLGIVTLAGSAEGPTLLLLISFFKCN